MAKSGLGRRALLLRGGRAALLATSALVLTMTQRASAKAGDQLAEIALPPADRQGGPALAAVLAKRRSIREFSGGSLATAELSQLLWAGQGITNAAGYRTAPSAGALYPLELYVAVAEVESLGAGIYRYAPETHRLQPVAPGDRRRQVSQAALSQGWIADSAMVIAIAAIPSRTTRKYGDRGVRYVHMEAGHVAQNVCLQAACLDLAVTPVGAFRDDDVRRVLAMPDEAEPIYLLPVGRR